MDQRHANYVVETLTTIAIHQPNFFPWFGYFDKIARCDYFVFQDDVQYSKGSMTNRTYIVNNNKQSYLTCPITYHHPSKINEIKISDGPWKTKAIRVINSNYHGLKAHHMKITNMILLDEKLLSEYNIKNIMDTCKLIDIKPRKEFIIQSDIINSVGSNIKGSKLIQHIVTRLGGTTYYSGCGGKLYLNESEFEKERIKIEYQNTTGFPTTSIIDVLLTGKINDMHIGGLQG